MNINTSIGLRDRSRITLSNFKGLDTLSAAVDVSAIHATDMKNLISRDGVNHKRFGWKTQFRIRDNGKYLKIQGIFDFTIYHERFLIVYAGKKFWRIDTLSNNYQDITDSATTIAVIDKTLLIDTECKCYINGNKAYFIGCGDLLVFSKWNNDKFELRRVVGNEDVYIPTTTENIGSEEDGQHYTRITAEEKNILSPYTYNLLFGVEVLKSGSVANYYLDCNDFTDIEVSVERQGKETIILTKSTETGVYNVGDKIKNTEFTLTNIDKSNTTSGTIKETAIPHTITTTEVIKHSDRWYTYSQAQEEASKIAGYFVSPYLDTGSERSRACNVYNPYTGKTCGTYQGYLDYLYQNYVGKPPNTTTETVKKTTTTTYTYENACEISIGITSLITLITMEKGDKLAIRNTVKTYSASTFYGKVDGTDVYYKKPEKISFSLVYIKANGNETVLRTVSEKNVSCSITSVTKNSIKANITYSYDTLSCDLTNFNAVISSIEYGEYINKEAIKLKSEAYPEYTGQVDTSEMKLTLNSVSGNESAYAPLVPDVPNIKVKLTRPFDASIVTSAIRACEFGAQGGTDRLFIVDNTGNTVRWSKDEDFTYFGEKSWCVCGTSDKSITGMDRLNDSTLLIVKEYSPREPSIFIITGNILTGETEAGTVDYTALFTPHGYQVGMGAVGEIINFNGDCLMVAKDGLYAVSLGENMTVDSRYVLHRSRQISNKLEKFNLSKAKCVSFNGKFFVYVGGEEQECYVADNKYTASFEGDIQNVVNYEWWRWTNIPVNVWGFVENELWFGTEDGQLCSFTENFYDETFSRLHTGLATYEVDENEIVGFTLNKDIKVSIGDIFTPTCDFYGGITTDRFECVNGETRFYLPLNDYLENETIYINNNAYTITKQDLYFSIQYSTDSNEITFYRNYKNKPLTVMDEVVIALKDRDNKFPKWSAVKSQGGLNPSNEEFTATLSHKEPVVSKWVSGAMDLGTRAYSKSLTYLVLTGEKDLANRLKYGLKTRFTHRDYELLRANNDLDFTELDLQTVSLDSEFASSYAKKLNIRNINFLMFYFVSDTAEDVALNSVQIEFKLFKRNIGVK